MSPAIWIDDQLEALPLVAILSYVRACDHGVSLMKPCVQCSSLELAEESR